MHIISDLHDNTRNAPPASHSGDWVFSGIVTYLLSTQYRNTVLLEGIFTLTLIFGLLGSGAIDGSNRVKLVSQLVCTEE